MEHWNQSVPFGEVSFPTPPDTISETSSDCPDMSGQWSQTSLPEDWSTVPAQGNSTWQSQGVPVTTQDLQALDSAALLSASSRPVDLRLSPVLSHESQSARTLTSFSEPDSCVLPPGLDLSFATDPSWNPSGPAVYNSPDVTTHSIPCHGFTPFHDQSGLPLGCTFSSPHALYPGSQPPVFFPQGAQAPYQSRSVSYPQLTPMRPLLPRTEGPSTSCQATHGPQRTLRPHMQGSHSSQRTVSSVSSACGPSQDGSPIAFVPAQASGHGTVPSQQLEGLPYGPSGHASTVAPPPSALLSYSQAGTSVPFMSDPTDEDFSTYIHFDQDDQSASPGALRLDHKLYADVRETDHVDSYMPGYGVQATVPSNASGDVKPVFARPEQDTKAVYQVPGSDSDEGRHRAHPLYNEKPKPDGFYHCPFKVKDPNCPHIKTKLKCNYEYDLLPFPSTQCRLLTTHCLRSKYIDSHLKPFRCKVESCAKQEFSSTACLLRHEREAHGMHGHGDRPHLCFYPGCERGIPGNGFPRRYNLFDHMKRVHDHKEEPASSTGSPVLGAEGQKKAGGRKRKASAPLVEPVAQRQKAMPVSQPQPQVTYQPTPGYFPQSVYDAEPFQQRNHHKQRILYHQWASQRELLAKQMDFVQSPDDEDHLYRLSQNLEEFRRLSAEARRG